MAILSRYGDTQSFKNGLPGFPEDENSRYVEAIINDVVVACLYLPNGNPTTDSKFNYKSEWIKHFTLRTKKTIRSRYSCSFSWRFQYHTGTGKFNKPELR